MFLVISISLSNISTLKKHFTTEHTEITEEKQEVTIIDGSTKKVNYFWCSNSLFFFANFASGLFLFSTAILKGPGRRAEGDAAEI
jgi:membrane protein insertase Oxa1/YidC/SpoIIIJ